MTMLLALLGRWGVPERFRKVILFLFAVLLLIVVLGVGKCTYDRNVIKDHMAEQEAANARADRAADQKAADQRREDDARLVQEREELKKAVTYAPQDPAVDDATERRLAFHRCLRLQQQARAANREPPSCL